MSTGDRYAEWDAAYVLGALSPDERSEFEQHLAECDRCRNAVGELAGMPGLLAQVPPAEAWAMLHEHREPSDPFELPTPVRPASEVAPSSPPARLPARSPWWQRVAAAVLVAVLGGLGGYGVRALIDEQSTRRLAFTAVAGPSAMTAVVDLATVDDGTEVRVECQYAEQTEGETYSVWVVDSHGNPSRVKPWTIRPNRVMRPTGVTPLSLRSITAVEIHEGEEGPVLLRADR